VHSIVAGGAAGCGTKTITAPLSRLTILFQVGKSLDLRAAAKREGVSSAVLSLWRGNTLSMAHKIPFSACNYFMYEYAKIFLHGRRLWKSDESPGFKVRFASGLAAGASSVVFAYPLDILRTRIAAGDEAKNTVQVAKEMFQTSGVSSFYGGLSTSVYCQSLNLALNFALYETFLDSFLKPAQNRGDFSTSLGCGALAGITASTIIHPLDLIRRRQQVMSSPDSMVVIMRAVINNDGFLALYRGLGPELIKVAPAVGLNFYIYEFVRRELLCGSYAPR
jgi:solute carrier family 25 phosphate transporter 23/24/25/41